MKIVICGPGASGKSSVAKLVAKELGYRHYSMGDFQRELAAERGLSIAEWGRLEASDDKYDRVVDQRMANIGKKEDDFVIDTWLGAHFVPDAIKVYVDAEIAIRAGRRLKHKRPTEHYPTLDEVRKGMLERESVNRERWIRYYGFDYADMSHYDLVIDTSEISIPQVVDRVLDFIKAKMSDDEAVRATIQSYELDADQFHREHSDINAVKNHADRFLEMVPGKRILDAGCGPGRDAAYFAGKGYDVTGIDMTAAFVDIAKASVPQAKFLCTDMRKLSFADGSFDGIWACASLLHVPKKDASKTLLGFWRVLSPKGIMFIAVKAGADQGFREGGENERARFYAYYGEDEIRKLVGSSGFKVLDVVVEQKRRQWINVFAIKVAQ
jgi:predicted cytidylate kinase